MQVLVLNSGSSSLKFQLFLMPEATILCSGLVERIGFKDAIFKFNTANNKIEKVAPILDHNQALEILSTQLLENKTGIISSTDAIDSA